MDELMSEQIIHGGCVATRAEVYEDCISLGLSARWADYYAFRSAALQENDARPSLTLKKVREWELRYAC